MNSRLGRRPGACTMPAGARGATPADDTGLSETSWDGPASSVTVRHKPPSVEIMKRADWAEEIARKLLEIPLPRRWAHSQGVAVQARALVPILGRHADL